MDLSILIPSRNEMFLGLTIENILQNIQGDTEIIAVCDGAWPEPPIKDHPRVTLVHHSESIGQRAATNEAARLSTAKFVMKCDAHCTFDKGFDVKLMADCEPDWTVVPRMYNLHAFDWKCQSCGKTWYQGPTPSECKKCHNKEGFERVIVWKKRESRKSDHWRFDKDLHFQYWGELGKRPESKGDIVPTMSFIGACWFMHRSRYWELDGLDEKHGSWGQVGTEVSCKSWLSGGQLLTNKKTWFSHMFRTQGGDFSFPYPMKGSDQDKARKHSRRLWLDNKWPKQKYPLSWMVKKFWPVPGWDKVPEDNGWKQMVLQAANIIYDRIQPSPPSRGIVSKPFVGKSTENVGKAIVYYTDSHCAEYILLACRRELEKCMKIHRYPIVSVSQVAIDFGKNIVMNIPRSVLSMFKQILAGIQGIDAEYIFLVEHDVLYHPSHFDFTPPRKDVFYYNRNRWAVSADTGKAVFYQSNQVSHLCAHRDLLIEHYTRAVSNIEKEGFKHEYGFAPPKGLPREQRIGKYDCYFSEFPSFDIRHEGAFTRQRMNKSEFNSERSCRDWKESDGVPGWGKTLGRFDEFLRELSNA